MEVLWRPVSMRGLAETIKAEPIPSLPHKCRTEYRLKPKNEMHVFK